MRNAQNGSIYATNGAGLTFADLKAEHAKRAAASGQPEGSTANEKTAFRRFMATFGLTDGMPIVPMMTGDFEARLREFECAVRRGRGQLSDASIVSYRSRLRGWHDLAVSMAPDKASDVGFQRKLGAAVAGFQHQHPATSFRSVAKSVGIARATLRGWLNGVRPWPTPHTFRGLAALERLLGLREGTLTSEIFRARHLLAGDTEDSSAGARPEPRAKDLLGFVAYRPRLASPKMEAFLKSYERHKSSLHPGTNLAGDALERPPGGKWRVISGECETAENFRQYCFAMIGWLLLPTTEDGARAHVRANLVQNAPALSDAVVDAMAPFFVGKGMRLDDITPCHLLLPELAAEFLEWRTLRSATERPSGYHRGYLAKMAQLIRPETGYLAQCVEHVWDHFGWSPADPAGPAGEAAYRELAARWKAICAKWHRELRGMQHAADNGHKERDPHAALQAILDFENPMDVIDGIVAAHAAEKPQGTLESEGGGFALALWYREQLLLRMLAEIPLRNRNYRQAVWREDNTGNLYRKGAGWRLRFRPVDFKNERGAARVPYDVALPEHLHPWIETYLEKARPRILGGKATDALFVTRYGGPFDRNALSGLVAELTGRFMVGIVDAPGFRMHAFRHIEATAYLRHNPESYLTVADILHDTIETVLENYARRSPEDGLRRWGAWRASTSALTRYPGGRPHA